MIFFDVVLETTPEARERMIALLRDTMEASRAETGCLIYRFTSDLDDPLRFYLVELWANEADLTAHASGAAFRDFIVKLKAVGKVISSKPLRGDLETYKFVRPS